MKHIEPLAEHLREARIQELKAELNHLLSITENVKTGKSSNTTHGNLRSKYNTKITCIRNYGVEHPTQLQSTRIKMVQTRKARYGDSYGGTDKAKQTKLQKYGKAGIGNTEKSAQTKRERYNGKWFDVDKLKSTLGVEAPCQLPQCRAAHKHVISATNIWWQQKLLQELDITFDCDDVNLDNKSYDLHCKHLLIEICPTISHNSTYGYAYAIGKSKHNYPLPFDYHFNKTQLALKHGYTCITVFDWMSFDAVIDTIRKHLADEPVDSTDFALNPQLSDDKSTIRKHWFNKQTRKYVSDNAEINCIDMLANGFVEIYDCGHASII